MNSSKPLTLDKVMEQLQRVLHDLSDLSEFGAEGQPFQGVVIDALDFVYRDRPLTKWRITIEQIVGVTKTGKTLTNSDIERLADEAEQGYDVEHLQPHFREGFEEARTEDE